ncbi:hypothetical protein EJ02DRAFT_460504 [Clathrospora elynae]|uniref:Peptidase S54 rhomboid domain-containing protein n=1 Tax=Clathrospora elynae TaxID=706981 RepID=A0A6A5S3S0_9PLEO|nr:hypothetical protein EJ02DRAFT_460504 [Clathrospora elynae]
MYTRFASKSTTPPSSAKRPPAGKQKISSLTEKRQADAARKASQLLNRLTKASKKTSQDAPKVSPSENVLPASTTINPTETEILPAEVEAAEQTTIEIDEQEEAVRARIIKQRRKILWPGIWTVFAVAGTYGAFAYLDAKSNKAAVSGLEQQPDRIQLPPTWFLTPTVVRDGIAAGWKELDKLTIGIVVASVAIQLTRRSPLPFWENLIHVTGERKYTAFTYLFVHSNWGHLGQNMLALCWFLPGVVRYFDGDFFHTAAFFVSVPLITSYFQHFTFRMGAMQGIPLNMGSSGAIVAVFGAFCMVYPDEKMWWPSGLILRLDAKYWAGLFAFWQLAALVKTPSGGNRPAFIVHLLSLGLGASYVYFDGKNNIWRPLLSQFSKNDLITMSQ